MAETCRLRVSKDSRWGELRRDFCRLAIASLESRLVELGIRVREDMKVPGLDRDGGSEARESRTPAIFKRSAPSSLRSAKMVGRSEEV